MLILNDTHLLCTAMAHLKLKSWAQAEADATSALQIDPLHYKSYQRRCVARLSMGKVRAALLDICAAEDSCRLWMEHEKGSSSVASSAKSSLMEIQKLRLKVEKALWMLLDELLEGRYQLLSYEIPHGLF